MPLKLIYIAGLEHSGTTLLDHLLSQHPDALGLGEITSFFSPTHMENYMRQWGHMPDAQICSCGELWNDCPFWGPVMELNGLNSNLPLLNKYSRLISYVKTHHKKITTIIDSSKSRGTLELLFANFKLVGLESQNVHVILLVKDVRSFAASAARKLKKSPSVWSHLRTFNWWTSANLQYLAQLKEAEISYSVVLYEHLCFHPTTVLNGIFKRFDLNFDQDLAHLERSSHIAMGNKDFAIRNSDKIRYDDAWMADDRIDIAYALHWRGRRLNQTFHQLSQS